ncbi:30S ribosomal protein S16 [Arcanobacterium hippocoleae]|uniref:Small ribosomal subunit protein bS16 n=1 Tax=Arcanobacterium hippocoleae TaxID=149017 RepID=A0ABU1T174_9ACTO|nr:30S ribosomal protein S16 [Arcanobacterium hippocoleae]MDR6939102.1 small subunit ribosomal protein S16 [Arcanobacterium hippocoleae]
MAVKIRLKRMGKIREAIYRVVVVDSRKKRDGRVIEEIGFYNPNTNPSIIDINSERARYWISVGAQPSEPVLAQLKITGDWQAAKGLEGESTLRVFEKVDAQKAREEAVKAVQDDAEKRRAEKAAAREKAEAEAKAAAEAAAEVASESSEAEEA